MKLGLRFIVSAIAAVLTGHAAQAETLRVEGIYAAETDAPSQARSIALASFDGRGGERVAFAIDEALRGAVIAGQPYFAVTFAAPDSGGSYRYDRAADPDAARGGADAVMRGIADVAVRNVDNGTKEVEECVRRDDRDKCLERKKVSYPCRLRTVELRPEVRLVAREGALLYAKGDTLIASQRFCEDEGRPSPVETVVQQLAADFAAGVRNDLAPTERAEDIRILESREGIAKADHNAFRAAVRLTKTDPDGACRAFAALEAAYPRDISIQFNLGLCHESKGELAEAAAQYDIVLQLKPGKLEPQEGLSRLASRERAERQLSIHYGDAPR
jgi:hypothetical protein